MRVAGKAGKIVVLVELGGRVVDRVHHDELAAGLLCGGDDPFERPHEEEAPQTRALCTPIEGELCEEDRGDLPWRAAADLRRHRIALN